MNWSKKEMVWYNRALEFNEYPAQIVEFMKSFYKKEETLLDLGSGIGTFSLPFAKEVKKVIAVDKDREMLFYLQSKAKENDLDNIETIWFNWNENNSDLCHQISSPDIVFSSYTGPEIMGTAKSLIMLNNLAKKYVFLLVPETLEKHSFGTEELFVKLGRKIRLRKVTSRVVFNLLQSLKINFESKGFEYQFGQPFLNFTEAMDFFSTHYEINTDKEKIILKEFLRQRIKKLKNFLWIDNFKTGILIWWKVESKIL